MNEKIASRIERLVQEINELLGKRETLHSTINKINDEIIAKQGAIYELKKLIDELTEAPKPDQSEQNSQ